MIRKLIPILGLVLAMTGAADAQFKGLGKKLLDKAKDEVENTLLQESDDQADDSAESNNPPSPDNTPPKKEAKSVVHQKADNAKTALAGEMAWIAERKPFEAPTTVRAVIHDPNVVAATHIRGLEIDLRHSSGGTDYHIMPVFSDSAGLSSGVIRLKVDGAEAASETYGGTSRPQGFRDASIIDAMKAGERLTIEYGPAQSPNSVILSLAGFGGALTPNDLNVNQGALMRAQSIGNSCVQREGKFNYKCACMQNAFVAAIPAEAQYGPVVQTKALETAQAKCAADIQANPLLGELSIQEALLGARLSAAGAGAPEGAVTIGDMIPGGPAHAIGLRSGDMIVKVGSAAAAQQLLAEKPFRPGARSLTIYTPLTDETRDVRIQLAEPPADVEMKHLAPFKLAAAPAPKPAATSKPVPKAPEKSVSSSAEQQSQPQKITYADPVGEACARDARLSSLYDCGCIDAKAPQIREDLSDKQYATATDRLLPRRELTLRNLEKLLAAETQPQRIEQLKRSMERLKQDIAALKTRPDPASHDESAVSLYAYKDASCKIGDYFRETEKKNCLASASLLSVSDPETHCACSANKAAELWLQSGDQQYRSTIATQIVTQARQACRG